MKEAAGSNNTIEWSLDKAKGFAHMRANAPELDSTDRLLWRLVEIACHHRGYLRSLAGNSSHLSPERDVIKALLSESGGGGGGGGGGE